MERVASVHRKTKETDITVELNLDGSGQSSISIGVAVSRAHAGTVCEARRCSICKSIAKATSRSTIITQLKTSRSRWARHWSRRSEIRSGINRYGEAVVPMDEALCRSVIDLSGRFYLVYEVQTRRQMIGNFSVELAEHFWRSFAETAKFNLHIDCLRGRNTHHILEGTFKASARALRQAVERNSRITGIPSTKGSL